jgi:CPA1 family monovalent cation:H+ antiporter
MDMLTIISVLISLSAVFSFINYRYFRLPRTIGLMLFALVLSIVLIVIGRTGWDLRGQAAVLIQRIDFNRFLLQGVLGFLLFAGALHVEANELCSTSGSSSHWPRQGLFFRRFWSVSSPGWFFA